MNLLFYKFILVSDIMVNQEIQELRKVVQVSDLLKLNRKIENIYYMGEGFIS